MRYIKLDENNVVTSIRFGLEIKGIGEIESDSGELGQIMQDDGSFLTPEQPIVEVRPSVEDQINSVLKEIGSIENQLLSADEKYKLLDKTTISLEVFREAKIEQLSYLCSQSIYEGFTTPYGFFGFNANDQSNFSQQMLVVVADAENLIETIQWKTKDNGVIELAKQEFMEVINYAKEHKINQQKKYWMKEDLVLVSTTKEEIDSIVW